MRIFTITLARGVRKICLPRKTAYRANSHLHEMRYGGRTPVVPLRRRDKSGRHVPLRPGRFAISIRGEFTFLSLFYFPEVFNLAEDTRRWCKKFGTVGSDNGSFSAVAYSRARGSPAVYIFMKSSTRCGSSPFVPMRINAILSASRCAIEDAYGARERERSRRIVSIEIDGSPPRRVQFFLVCIFKIRRIGHG